MPGGFTWVGSESDDPRGKVKTFTVAAAHATRLSPGDAVVITSTADANGIQQVDAAAAGAAFTGIIESVDPNFTTEAFTDIGLPAGVAGSVKVNTDPRAIYEVDVSNGPLVITDVGLNLPLVAAAATVSGGLSISNMTVNKTGAATTAATEWRLVKLVTGSDGVLGSRCQVRANNTTTIAGAAGV